VLLADVNVLIYAHRPESCRSTQTREWLADALAGDETFGSASWCSRMLGAPAAQPVRPGARHWSIFAALCRQVGARGNVVPDAFHAAPAIENGATWITTDHGFARFPGLRWRPLLDG